MKLFVLILASINFSFSQDFIDTVFSFTPGTIQSSGQADMYYPENIFGPPSYQAARNTPEIRPEEILSIGLNGEIIVGLKSGSIINGEGADIVIFENAFEISFNNKIYAEPAIVSVSEDGEIWHTFDFNLDSLTGLAGTNPTFGNAPNSEFGFSGGNAFDLEELNLEEIRFIKIKDTTEYIINNPDHNNYDPTLSGFDLDAVLLINTKIDDPINSILSDRKTNNIIGIFDINGNKVEKIINSGKYFVIYENGLKKVLKY